MLYDENDGSVVIILHKIYPDEVFGTFLVKLENHCTRELWEGVVPQFQGLHDSRYVGFVHTVQIHFGSVISRMLDDRLHAIQEFTHHYP